MALNATMSRRSFVKASALAGAAAAIGTSMSGSLVQADPAYAAAEIDRKVMKTSCHGCIQMCPAIAYLENGVVTKLEGDPAAPVSRGSLCIKGLNQVHTVYSPRRVLRPLKRAGERGQCKWEAISWDEAIEYTAENIKKIIDQHGPYAFFSSVGGGGAYSFMEAMTIPMAMGSPTVFEPGCAQCYLPRWALSKLFYGGNDQSIADNAVQEIFRPAPNNHAEVVVCWAAQPSVSQTAESARGMAELRAAGVKTIVVDPNFSPDAQKADVWLPVRPGTDTGVILSWYRYIFENKLYDENFVKYWTNLPFLIDPDTKLPVLAKDMFPGFNSPTPANTPAYVCYDLKTNSVKPFVYSAPEKSDVDPEIFTTQTIDGKTYKSAGQIYKEEAEPWTLQKAEEVCWVPAKNNEEAIKMYATAKVAGIANGVASDMTESASQVPLGCMGLDSIMGYINKPGCTMTQYGEGNMPKTRPITMNNGFGGMFSPMYGIGAVVGFSEAENEAWVRGEETPLGKANIAQQELANQLLIDRLGMVDHKGLYAWCHSHIPTVREAIATGEPYKPRVWFDMSGNKLAMLGNAKSWFEVFPEVDFIIGQYPMLTSFQVEACDIVFPLREWLEAPMVNMCQLNTQWLQNECTHLGETVSNSIPGAQVLNKLREKWGGKLPGLVPGYLGAPSEEAVKAEVAQKLHAPSWDELVNNTDKYVPYVTPEEEYFGYNQHEVVVDDGLPAGFGTESRKIEVYCQILLKTARTGYPYCYPKPQKACADYSPICTYIEPADCKFNKELKDADKFPLILTSGRVPYFHHGTMRHAPFSRELYPVPDLRINPKDAKERGIKHMEWVKISSRRGEISGRAYITEGVAPGVVWMERYWNPECFDESVPEAKRNGGWRQCNVNILTKNTAPFNEVFGSYTNRGFGVQVEKGSKPEGIWTEPEQFKPFLPTLMNEPRTKDVTFK